MSIIQLNNIEIKYGKKVVIDDFNLEIKKGEMVAITGKTGSGKTSLLNVMCLLQNPSKGKYKIFDYENPKLRSKNGRNLLKKQIGIIFQNSVLIEKKTVEENLKMSYDKNGEMTIAEALEFVSMQGSEKQKVYQLSGGEQQRIAIARVLIKKFEIIFGDEITGSLDENTRDEIIDIMKKLSQRGKTIVLVTHDSEVVKKCERNIIVNKNI